MSAPVVEINTFVDEPSSIFTNSQKPLGICSDVKSKITNRIPPSTGQGSKAAPVNVSGNKTVFDFYVDSERVLLRETAIELTVYFTNATGDGPMINSVPIWNPWSALVGQIQLAINGGSPFVYQTVSGYFQEQHMTYMLSNYSETALNALEWCMTPAISPLYAITDNEGGFVDGAVPAADAVNSTIFTTATMANGAPYNFTRVDINPSSIYTQRLLKYFPSAALGDNAARHAITATNSHNEPFHIIIPLGDALGVRWSSGDIAAANIHKIHLEITWNARHTTSQIGANPVISPMFVSMVSRNDDATNFAQPSAQVRVASCFMLVPVVNMSASEKLSTVDGKLSGKSDIVGFIGSAPVSPQPSITMIYSGVANVDSVFAMQAAFGRRGGPGTRPNTIQFFTDSTQYVPFGNYRLANSKLITSVRQALVAGMPDGLTMSYGSNLQSFPSYPIRETEDAIPFTEELYYFYKSLTGKYGRRDLVPMIRPSAMNTTMFFEALRGWGPEHITLSRVAMNLQIRHSTILNGPPALVINAITYNDDPVVTLVPMIVFAFTVAPDSRVSTFVGY